LLRPCEADGVRCGMIECALDAIELMGLMGLILVLLSEALPPPIMLTGGQFWLGDAVVCR